MKGHRIVFMGTPPFAVASLNALLDARMDVAAVVTAPDRPAGRGQRPRMSAVKERALALGLPVLQPEKLKDPGFHAQLDACGASLYVVVAFRMLPEAVWARPPLGSINLHASLLPDYRGAAPINWAVINGERRTGVTTFFIQQEIDTGAILLRETTDIGPDETAGELHDRLMHIGARLLTRTVKDLFDGTVEGMPQERFIGDATHHAPKLTPENCRIPWHLPAKRVHDHIRGLSPHPGAWTQWQQGATDAQHFKVLRTRLLPDERSSSPGTVRIDGDRLLVHCGEGAVEALEVQAQGRRTMEAAAFVRGLRDREGIRLA